MTIAILPARLANQIAAGEVVERPASVIKELVENSLDAGATSISIDVDKGGVKRIRISDNGTGIVKDELTLALSRHATSKIKKLSDLEAINSLGFRGEALASISSVSRLTLISKPSNQDTAWQANAQGRDMAVTIKPAAHPDGTTIEVLDLFFNTPARRKFLRTEKTEFNHIDEVIRRVALARFDVTFSLTHNGKTIRQYRAATTQAQNSKRVAMVCGQKFVDNAIEINCQHDDMVFSGWLAQPSFARNQNDLSYSYVNGRMMRDKLINHAIRQAYADLLPPDTYPAFVLFLSLDHREVDVNVHPAKHEVRFHQSRYVHDFIYSVCHKALLENSSQINLPNEVIEHSALTQPSKARQGEQLVENVQYARPEYVKPLHQIKGQQVSESQVKESTYRTSSATTGYNAKPSITKAAVANYQQLMTPVVNDSGTSGSFVEPLTVIANPNVNNITDTENFFLTVEQGGYGVFKYHGSLRLLSLFELALQVQKSNVAMSWQQSDSKAHQGLISQPLLLPVVITLSEQQISTVQTYQEQLTLAGIIFTIKESASNTGKVQIRQFPALLREQDVSASFTVIIDELLHCESTIDVGESNDNNNIISAVAKVLVEHSYTEEQAQTLWLSAKKALSAQKIESILLNSVALDLTSHIKQVKLITNS